MARNYSSKEFLEFLDYVSNRNLMKRNTVESWRTASQKVLSALDDSEKEDLRSLDVAEAAVRFENKMAGSYKPESLRVYKSRFSAAREHFLRWADDPSTFRISIGTRNGSSAPKATSHKKNTKRGHPLDSSRPSETREKPANDGTPSSSDTLVLPIPLRPGVLVKVFGIPGDLTESEARKITAVINAYALAD